MWVSPNIWVQQYHIQQVKSSFKFGEFLLLFTLRILCLPSRVRFPAGAGNFSLHHRVQNGSGAHPVSYPMDTRGSFLGVKRAGRAADHSPPPNAEVKE